MLSQPTDEMFEVLSEAEGASQRAKELTNQLLTFSKGGAPVRKTTRIDGIILDTARFALRGARVRGEFDIPTDLHPVDADQGQISQVIHNMVINAVQAMPAGGMVEVKARNLSPEESSDLSLPTIPYIAIVIHDQGAGIPDAVQAKIFDPYFTTKKTGSGLGLATAYSIVKNHDGQIRVESREGIGTKFTIYLPASMKKVSAPTPLSKDVSPGSGRILVMDDEEMVRAVVQRMLTQLGYEVQCTADGIEAIQLYRQAMERNRAFDLVLMDLTIPGGMGGKDALARLKEIESGRQRHSGERILQCPDHGRI